MRMRDGRKRGIGLVRISTQVQSVDITQAIQLPSWNLIRREAVPKNSRNVARPFVQNIDSAVLVKASFQMCIYLTLLQVPVALVHTWSSRLNGSVFQLCCFGPALQRLLNFSLSITWYTRLSAAFFCIKMTVSGQTIVSWLLWGSIGDG